MSIETSTPRDSLMFVGTSASGKTAGMNIVRYEILPALHILFQDEPISDSHTILKWVLEDHKINNGLGLHHDHPWCENTQSHRHDNEEQQTPFTLTSDFIPKGMFTDFFNAIRATKPPPGKLLLAEWSGGMNTNPKEDLASRADVSFKWIAEMFRRGDISSQGVFDRVLAVFHFETPWEIRNKLNVDRPKSLSEEDIKFGRASWQLAPRAMRIFGEDDFDVGVRSILEASGIPHVVTVHNDGTHEGLKRGIEKELPAILETWSRQEWQIRPNPERE